MGCRKGDGLTRAENGRYANCETVSLLKTLSRAFAAAASCGRLNCGCRLARRHLRVRLHRFNRAIPNMTVRANAVD